VNGDKRTGSGAATSRRTISSGHARVLSAWEAHVLTLKTLDVESLKEVDVESLSTAGDLFRAPRRS
jgi:hypothetical protein